MDSFNDLLGQLMEFISMYLKDSVSVKDLNDKNSDFLFLKNLIDRKQKTFIVVSHKKHFITPNIIRMLKLIHWRYEWRKLQDHSNIPAIQRSLPRRAFQKKITPTWVSAHIFARSYKVVSQSIISPRQVLQFSWSLQINNNFTGKKLWSWR